jgi:hypothetical protein
LAVAVGVCLLVVDNMDDATGGAFRGAFVVAVDEREARWLPLGSA